MQINGQRVKRTRLIQSDQFVVAVEVELVVPPGRSQRTVL